MTDTTLAILACIATNAAIGLYAVGLLRRLRESEIRRLDAEREREESEAWADKWESVAVELVQENGDLRRQYAAMEGQHASLQAMYALRTVEMIRNSREIVEINVAWKRNK
jgi:hypothetical protein